MKACAYYNPDLNKTQKRFLEFLAHCENRLKTGISQIAFSDTPFSIGTLSKLSGSGTRPVHIPHFTFFDTPNKSL